MPVSSVLTHYMYTCMWLLSNLQQALVHYVYTVYVAPYTHGTFSHVSPQQASHSESEAAILMS